MEDEQTFQERSAPTICLCNEMSEKHNWLIF